MPTPLLTHLVAAYISINIPSSIVLSLPHSARLRNLQAESPVCCSLLFNKGTEDDGFEAPQVGLAEVAAAGHPDVVVVYFIRQVQRVSSLMREVHPWLGKVESSLSSILFSSTSDMQYPG